MLQFFHSLIAQSFTLGKFYYVDWLAMLMMFSSIYAFALKSRAGWVFSLVGNLCWIAFGLMVGSIADVSANIICLGMNIWGLWKWSVPSSR